MSQLNVLFLKALADENRIKMMDLLKEGPMCVSDICQHFDMRQPSVTHHLTLLKRAGIVDSLKSGKEMMYSLNDQYVNNCCAKLSAHYSDKSESKDIYKMMVRRMRLHPDLFRAGNFGLEKENLRVNDFGYLDQSDHPITEEDSFFPYIVKDFAESQVEFITKPLTEPSLALEEMSRLQDHFVKTYDVRLWPFSMPCGLVAKEAIRIAEFPNTKAGKMARDYREMLALRHGKKMQLISGVHYNFSFSDAFANLYKRSMMNDDEADMKAVKNDLYFHVARNILRYKWLLIYLFGASPFVDSSYKSEVTAQLNSIEHSCECCIEAHTYYEDYATSLRMSRYGYHNKLQEKMRVSYNTLEEYTHHMRQGIDRGILQKESEYYAPLRFKNSRGIKGSMLDALESDGVEYLELRLFDLNPYETYGITMDQMYLTHLFLVYSAIKPSPCISGKEMTRIYANGQLVSLFGRKDDKEVYYRDGFRSIDTLGLEILGHLKEIAEILDTDIEHAPYMTAVKHSEEILRDKSLLLSERLTRELLDQGLSYLGQGIRHSIYEKKEVLR